MYLTELAEDEDKNPQVKRLGKTIDGGGLFHINHSIFMHITWMELQILKEFHEIECSRVSAEFNLKRERTFTDPRG